MSWSDEFLTAAIEERCRKLSPPDLAEQIMVRAGAQPSKHVQPTESVKAQPERVRLVAVAVALVGLAAVVGVWRAERSDDAQSPKAWLPLQRGAAWHYRVESPDGEWRYSDEVIGSVIRGSREYYLLVGRNSLAQDEEPDGLGADQLLACDGKGIWQDLALEQLQYRGMAPAERHLLTFPVRAGDTWQWSYETLHGVLQFHGEVLSSDVPCVVPAGSFRAAHVRATITRAGVAHVEDRFYARGVGLVRRVTTRDGLQLSDAQLTRHEKGRPAWQPRLALPEQLAKSEFHALGMPDELRVVPPGMAGVFVDSKFVRVRYGEQWRLWRMTRERLFEFDPADPADWDALAVDEGLFVPPKHQPRAVANQLAGLAGRLFAASAGGEVTSDPAQTNFTSFVEKDGRASVNLKALQSFVVDGKTVGMRLHCAVRRGRIVKVSVGE